MLERSSRINSAFLALTAGGFTFKSQEQNEALNDHTAWVKGGFKAGTISQEYFSGDRNPNYHKPGDTFTTVNIDYMLSVANFMKFVGTEALK